MEEVKERKAATQVKKKRFVHSDDYSQRGPSDAIATIDNWESGSDYFSDEAVSQAKASETEMIGVLEPGKPRIRQPDENILDDWRDLPPLEVIEIAADTSEEAIRDKDTVNMTCIWLHGLGADGHDLTQVAEYLQFPEHVSMRHILPHAPKRSITVNGGTEMRAWYDMRALPPRFNDSIEDIEQSAQQILKLLENDTSSSRYLLGFSQGGCLALYMALQYGERFNGIAALSCYIPHKSMIDDLRPGYICPPIFIGHGKFDPVIPYTELNNTARMIRSYCPDLVVRRYRGGHSIDSETIRDINYWFSNRI